MSENNYIHIKGARTHNLKGIEVKIPRNRLVVVTGLSGSGKSSLAFDTLFAEGQRRYVESLSAYARQFLGRMSKPDVDFITGIPPAIAIEQRVNTRNPRSTVGTSTEIYDYLRLLYARIGKTYDPRTGEEVKRERLEDVLEYIYTQSIDSELYILAPIGWEDRVHRTERLLRLREEGFSRLFDGEKVHRIDTVMSQPEHFKEKSLMLFIDRIENFRFPVSDCRERRRMEGNDGDERSRWADSIQTALSSGGNRCVVYRCATGQFRSFSLDFERDGMVFEEPSEHLFSFNNPLGACPCCGGTGMVVGIDEQLVIPNPRLSVYEDGVACWRGESMSRYKELFIVKAAEMSFPIHKPYKDLTEEQRSILWNGRGAGAGGDAGAGTGTGTGGGGEAGGGTGAGTGAGGGGDAGGGTGAGGGGEAGGGMGAGGGGEAGAGGAGDAGGGTGAGGGGDASTGAGAGACVGIDAFFRALEEQKHKIQNRFLISRYTGKKRCPECRGARLRKEALYVRVGGYTIDKLLDMPVVELASWVDELALNDNEQAITGRIVKELKNRLHLLLDTGLGYLTLNRASSSLSGGESQRINLVTSLGSTLTGSLYILDEPSIGLHPRDTARLITVLKQLRDLGNTVLVVEHDEEIIRAADRMIEVGPFAGGEGGALVFEGSPSATEFPKEAHTLNYLHGLEQIEVPLQRRKGSGYIEVKGAELHNLKQIDVRFPLQALTAVTGVSGSGKSTLVKNILYPLLSKQLSGVGSVESAFGVLQGDLLRIREVEMVDQNPIGRSSRSNPVTYIKAWDEIRKLYSEQPYAKQNGYGHSHFSFNIDGGRCPECQGEGTIGVEMQFMADVTLTCEACGGKRFQPDILEVRYQGKDISQLLEMTIEEAIHFFGSQKGHQAKKIVDRLSPLQAVGLSYVRLGQRSSTLSGGESQRVKLASFLSKEGSADPILFIFDEPTIGLHFHDINKLLDSLHALIARGHSVVVVEHNMEVVKSVDWVIDLGPDAGAQGGEVVFSGTPEALALRNDLHTGRALSKVLPAR